MVNRGCELIQDRADARHEFMRGNYEGRCQRLGDIAACRSWTDADNMPTENDIDAGIAMIFCDVCIFVILAIRWMFGTRLKICA